MKIIYDNGFDSFDNDEKSKVFQVFPDVFGDNRGNFSEVLKTQNGWHEHSEYPMWFSNLDWMKQINRSKSTENVVRGCHAQKGIFCQAKLVEAINTTIFDLITDARPNSSTFGVSKIFKLDAEKQNKLWIPRGFLHAFMVPEQINGKEAIFNYYVDNFYNKESEITINPKTLIPKVIDNLRMMCEENKDMNMEFQDLLKSFQLSESMIYSKKDENGQNYNEFMFNVMKSYENGEKDWYK